MAIDDCERVHGAAISKPRRSSDLPPDDQNTPNARRRQASPHRPGGLEQLGEMLRWAARASTRVPMGRRRVPRPPALAQRAPSPPIYMPTGSACSTSCGATSVPLMSSGSEWRPGPFRSSRSPSSRAANAALHERCRRASIKPGALAEQQSGISIVVGSSLDLTGWAHSAGSASPGDRGCLQREP